MRPSHLVAAVLFALSLATPATAGTLVGPVALRGLHGSLSPELARNAFGEPLVVRSQDGARRIEGHAYAVLDMPFALVGLLANRAEWCELLMLHLNNKFCRSAVVDGAEHIELYVGKKHEQPVQSATRLRFAWTAPAAREDYLAVRMAAADGPYGTRDYALVLEAVPLEGGRSFVHLGYAFGYGGASHVAMHLYLATVGHDKVGFTREEASAGQPSGHVGGMRGVVERNVMRYLLALRVHLGASAAPAQRGLDARLQAWFAATEKYPRQLHEIEWADYLAMKRGEFRRLALPHP